jgi:hypothetical protein
VLWFRAVFRRVRKIAKSDEEDKEIIKEGRAKLVKNKKKRALSFLGSGWIELP